MLRNIHISNYALIDHIDLDLAPGLNIITGETGAGKSIMLGALGLLLGARADVKAVKNSEAKSIVEAEFSVDSNDDLHDFCKENDLEWDDSVCILRREISTSGRSRAFVNDSPVTLAQLEEISRQLIDIHSQNQNRLLASPEYQLQIIDSLAENGDILKLYSKQYTDYRRARTKLAEIKKAIEQSRNDEEFTRFRLNQLTEASLVNGEQEELEKERDLLANMTDIKENLLEVLSLLSDGNSNVSESLVEAVELCENLAEVMDEAASLAQRLETARVEIQDVAETLAGYDANLQADPAELDEIEQRLDKLYSLMSRFKAGSVGELIAMRDELSSKLALTEDGEITLADLKKEVDRSRKEAETTALEISKRRRVAANEFASILLEKARPLGMQNLNVCIDIEPIELSPTGFDKLEFRFAFNKNQEPMPVGATASGGEVSRLMLCIKSITASKLLMPTIVFDEVDTGVSGDVANRMGQMMQQIAADRQVITITHLPQVAAKGTTHFKVFKEDDENSTHTRIKELSSDQRIEELALMLSGSASDPAAMAAARSLINQNLK